MLRCVFQCLVRGGALVLATSVLAGDPVQVSWGAVTHQVSPCFTGMNTSYFNDLEYVWALGDVEQRLREMRIGALRWPGGEETSRYHWEYPGVDGYADVWNTKHFNWTWQTIHVGSAHWTNHTLYTDLDRFIERCHRVRAEPVVGVNLSSGEVLDRREDGIASAVRMVQYIQDQGYPVRYVFLDNEPWHPGASNYHHFTVEEYAEVYMAYAKALREVAPSLRFIASPSKTVHWTSEEIRFMEMVGAYTDFLNFHSYWEFGTATVERWKDSVPLRNSSRWRSYADSGTYTEDLENIRKQLDAAGWQDVGLVMLEWNVGHLREETEGTPLTPYVTALAQAEIFLQLAAAPLHFTTLWPMFRQVRAPGFAEDLSPPAYAEQDRGPFTDYPDYGPRPTYRTFRMLRDISGSQWLETVSSDVTIQVAAIRSPSGSVHLYILNKSDAARVVEWPGDGHTARLDDAFDVAGRSAAEMAPGGGGMLMPPWSLAHVRLVPLPVPPGG